MNKRTKFPTNYNAGSVLDSASGPKNDKLADELDLRGFAEVAQQLRLLNRQVFMMSEKLASTWEVTSPREAVRQTYEQEMKKFKDANQKLVDKIKQAKELTR
jgi:hypothetical protein